MNTNSESQSQEKPVNILTSSHNTVAIYTVLSILVKMKTSLGLEAMLEYIGKYLEIIEQTHPKIKSAVSQALGLMSINKIYKEAMSNEK